MRSELLALLYDAVNSPHGTVIETNNAETLRAKLYALRREYEGEFTSLSFIISPSNGSDLWILKREPSNGD